MNTSSNISAGTSRITSHFEGVCLALKNTALEWAIVDIAHAILKAHQNRQTIYICGNGGSASNAGHLALHLAELGIFAVDLTAQQPLLTATANDATYSRIFSEPILKHGCPGDALMVISGSGNSPNIVMALAAAKQRGMAALGLLGFGGGLAAQLCDKAVVVDNDNYGVCEDVHATCCHALKGELQVKMKSHNQIP